MADDTLEEREWIFKRFDDNGDGKVSAAELAKNLKTLGCVSDEQIQRMMTKLDTDGDGYISFQEFTDFYNANRLLMKDVARLL